MDDVFEDSIGSFDQSKGPPVQERPGKIIIAEDQLHNMQVIKEQLTQLGKLDRCEFVYNG